MLDRHVRSFFTAFFTPLAEFLLARGVSPNVVTIVGTSGVVTAALICFPLGWLFPGVVFVTIFIFSDLVDGIMARTSQTEIAPEARGQGTGDKPNHNSRSETSAATLWGSFLDSTLDRIADSAIFSGIALWYFTGGGKTWIGISALLCLVAGSVVSYARAKAESLGLDAHVGIAERGERLVTVLVATGLVGLGLPDIVLLVALLCLAVASAYTIGQRISKVWHTVHCRPEITNGENSTRSPGSR